MPENNLLRVTQMNAIYLDKEIHNCLRLILQEASKNLPPMLVGPHEAELNLVLRLALLSASVLKSGSTFGQQLLSIKYESISSLQKVLYIVPTLFDYLKTQLEWRRPSLEVNNTLVKISTIFQLLDFINLSVFLRNGSKPLLVERILGLNQIYASENVQRQFQSKYLSREILWNGFIKTKSSHCEHQKHNHTFKMCVLRENPILPHHMGCVHIFCFVCLKGNQKADARFECPMCEHKNPNLLCDRLSVM